VQDVGIGHAPILSPRDRHKRDIDGVGEGVTR
jgi:hypothetical protein